MRLRNGREKRMGTSDMVSTPPARNVSTCPTVGATRVSSSPEALPQRHSQRQHANGVRAHARRGQRDLASLDFVDTGAHGDVGADARQSHGVRWRAERDPRSHGRLARNVRGEDLLNHSPAAHVVDLGRSDAGLLQQALDGLTLHASHPPRRGQRRRNPIVSARFCGSNVPMIRVPVRSLARPPALPRTNRYMLASAHTRCAWDAPVLPRAAALGTAGGTGLEQIAGRAGRVWASTTVPHLQVVGHVIVELAARKDKGRPRAAHKDHLLLRTCAA